MTKKIIRLTSHVMEYAWGNKTFIPSILHQTPDGKPKAELWMGAHSFAPSFVPEENTSLITYLQKHPSFVGKKCREKFGDALPLLLKVLAIDKPLSIQCHPSTSLAQQGWRKEEAYRKTHERGEWNYKDPNRKAEIIYALTPITAMCGFVDAKKSLKVLQSLIPLGYQREFSSYQEEGTLLLKSLFTDLYTMDVSRRSQLIEEMMQNLEKKHLVLSSAPSKEFLSAEQIIKNCYQEYPTDPGLFCPILLNLVYLEKGEALYLEPRTLHAYVQGNGIELMSASDNVLRGGLTHKKMDIQELFKVLQIKTTEIHKAQSHLDRFQRTVIESPVDEFSLIVMHDKTFCVDTAAFELLFVEEGSARIQSGEEEMSLSQGDTIIIHSDCHYQINCQGTVFVATVQLT